MSFLDTLKGLGLWQGQGQQPQQNPYGLDPQMVSQARMQSLGNIGGQILAMSQQMTPDQRARMMGQADWTGGMQGNLMNAAQMKLMGDAQRRKQAESEQDRRAQQYILGLIQQNPNDPRAKKAAIYAQLGDWASAGKSLTEEGPRPEIVVDEETGQFYDKSNIGAGAQAVPGWQTPAKAVDPKDRLPFVKEFENAPETLSYNVLSGTIGSLTNAVYDDSKVSDLDFVYGVAKALDPTSVVRESEGQMVIDAQGMAPSLLARINGIWGGGALLPQQRLELLALVRRRAEEYRKQAETKRQNVLRIGEGVVDDSLLRPLPMLPEVPMPPQQVSAPGRRDLPQFPEPELIEVQ